MAQNDAMYQFNQRLKGKTPEQESVIRYFTGIKKGCFGKLMKDEDYDKMVVDHLAANGNFKAKAISKIGLDESEISLIEPVCIQGYYFDSKNAYSKYGEDGKWRSSAYQVSWLFFSETQVYLYQYTFNFDENGKKEASEEYFYKDVVNFSSSEETVEKEVWVTPKGGCNLFGSPVPVLERKEINTVRLTIVVPGDKMYCAANVEDDSFETSIKGMKNLLREKKNNG